MKSTNNILSYIAKHGLIKEYALFLKIKRLHKNSVIYKPNKLHEKLSCSRTKVRRILGIIISEGWGYYSKGNLVLHSAETIHYNLEDYKPKNFIKVHSVEDIYLELLKNKLRQKKYIENKISDLQSYSRKVVKAAYKKLGGEKKVIDYGTSIKTVSGIYNLSVASCSRILNKLAKNGLISIQKRFDSFGQFNYHTFLHLQSIHKGIFVSKGNNMIVKQTSIISILEL